MGRHLAPLPAGHAPVRQGHQPHRLRRVRRDRAGIEGLVHVSEMDWTNKNVHPSKVVQLGDEVEVMVLEIDEERRRISLGMKQCMPNPWEEFAHEPQEGRQGEGPDQVDHRLRRLHRPARRHRRPGAPVRPVLVADRRGSGASNFKKGEEVEAVVLSIDVERERISLGIKQLEGDPVHQLHRQPRQEQRGHGHGQVDRRQGRGDRARAATSRATCGPPKFSRDRVEDMRTHAEGRRRGRRR